MGIQINVTLVHRCQWDILIVSVYQIIKGSLFHYLEGNDLGMTVGGRRAGG